MGYTGRQRAEPESSMELAVLGRRQVDEPSSAGGGGVDEDLRPLDPADGVAVEVDDLERDPIELREEFAQWAEEAQDGSKQEALENVLGHVEAVEREYKRRHAELRARINES